MNMVLGSPLLLMIRIILKDNLKAFPKRTFRSPNLQQAMKTKILKEDEGLNLKHGLDALVPNSECRLRLYPIL